MKRIAMRNPRFFLTVFGVIVALNGLMSTEALAQELKYDVWFSASGTPPGPPFTPTHDCWTISFDGSDVILESAGFAASGPAFVAPGDLNIFVAAWPAFGQVIFGWYVNGTSVGWQGDTIGGVMLRAPKTWAFEGVQNADCVFP